MLDSLIQKPDQHAVTVQIETGICIRHHRRRFRLTLHGGEMTPLINQMVVRLLPVLLTDHQHPCIGPGLDMLIFQSRP